MKKVFLHIGMHKTGSSSIQEALASLRSREFVYCDLMHPNHSMAFYTLFSKNYLNYHEWRKQGLGVSEILKKKKDYLQILEKYLISNKDEKIIFSAESISLLKDDEKKDMINYFKYYGCEINVICYVRDPLSYAYSSFQQDIKSGSIKVKDKYIPNYILRLDEFKKNSLINTFFVRDYSQLKDNNIVSDFFNLLEIKGKYKKNSYSNKRLSISALKIIFLINNYIKSFPMTSNLYETRIKFINLIEDKFNHDITKYNDYFSLNIGYEEVSYLRENFSINYKIENKKKPDDTKTIINRLECLSDIDHVKLNNLAKDLGIKSYSEKLENTVVNIFEILLEY